MSGRAFGAIAFIHCISFASPVLATDPPGRHEFESKHMGTTFRVVLYAPDRPTAEKAEKAVFARVTPYFSRSRASAASAAYPLAIPPRSSRIPAAFRATVRAFGSRVTFS